LRQKLEIDIAEAEIKIKELKSKLKKDIPREQKILLKADINSLKSATTETKRRLNNLRNT